MAVKGIHYVAQAAKFLNWVPLFMVLFVLWANRAGIAHYVPPQDQPLTGFLNDPHNRDRLFATAGAAGSDFGMNNGSRKDVVLPFAVFRHLPH